MNPYSYKSYLFPLSFLFSSSINRHHSSWLLGCFGCYFFKSWRCWIWRGSDTHDIFSQPSSFSDPVHLFRMIMAGHSIERYHSKRVPSSGLKVSTNELTIESGVLDEGDTAGLLQNSFENHFRDMFLNVPYITCTHSFKRVFDNFMT